MKGWVYIITNKSMPNLLKVGFSSKDPELRAEDFNGTGVPHRFVVEYDALVNEPREIEQKAHILLKAYHENKEWFKCDIATAIAAIRQAANGAVILETNKITNQHTTVDKALSFISPSFTGIEHRADRYVARNNGTAINNENTLMWLRFAHGQVWKNGTAVGNIEKVNWQTALDIAKQFNQHGGYVGHTDWRLPTIDELKTLIDKLNGRKGNYINEGIFPNNSGTFWSSSHSANVAYFLCFGNGSDGLDGKYGRNAVRLVRNGK